MSQATATRRHALGDFTDLEVVQIPTDAGRLDIGAQRFTDDAGHTERLILIGDQAVDLADAERLIGAIRTAVTMLTADAGSAR